jgi:16S rRNA processing protein RimM
VRGEVLVEVLTDVLDRFDVGKEVLLDRSGEEPRRMRIASRRRHERGLLLGFEGVPDRDGAERIKGASLVAERAGSLPAPEGSYYYYELLGCRCRDRGHGDLGEVVDLIEDGGGLLLVVGDQRRELLVPFVEPFLKRVDTAEGLILLELPEGLVETCGSGC